MIIWLFIWLLSGTPDVIGAWKIWLIIVFCLDILEGFIKVTKNKK
jgi:hypothetical protein